MNRIGVGSGSGFSRREKFGEKRGVLELGLYGREGEKCERNVIPAPGRLPGGWFCNEMRRSRPRSGRERGGGGCPNPRECGGRRGVLEVCEANVRREVVCACGVVVASGWKKAAARGGKHDPKAMMGQCEPGHGACGAAGVRGVWRARAVIGGWCAVDSPRLAGNRRVSLACVVGVWVHVPVAAGDRGEPAAQGKRKVTGRG